jgi:hypothetical protein
LATSDHLARMERPVFEKQLAGLVGSPGGLAVLRDVDVGEKQQAILRIQAVLVA